MLHRLKNMILNFVEKIRVFILEKKEIKKFKDGRRKKIYNSITLTKEQNKSIDNLYKKIMVKKFQIYGINISLLIQENLIKIIFQNYYIYQDLKII